jgi:hypothetical protein
MGVGYLKAKKIFDTLVELKFIQQVDGKNIFKVIICT